MIKFFKENQSIAKKSWSNFVGVIIFACLFIPLIFLNALQLLSALIAPIWPIAFRRFNRFLANYYWLSYIIILRYLHRLKITVTGAKLPKEENAIVICNHQNATDIPLLQCLAWSCDRLGDIKWFAKNMIKHIPGPGWGLRFLDCIFVKRNWVDDASLIEKAFTNLKRYRRPYWLISFLEGTRITPAKLQVAQQHCKNNNLPIFKHLLFPRTKGFIASVQALRKHTDAIYNITITYPNGIPSLWQLFKGSVKQVYMDIDRISIDQIPHSTHQIKEWIINKYQEKDQKLADFYREGKFKGYTRDFLRQTN